MPEKTMAMQYDLTWPLPDPVFEHHRCIAIFGITSASTSSGYPHVVTVQYLPWMRQDFADIRFTQLDGTPCPHFITRYTAGVSASCMVKVPSANQTMLFCYYGANTLVSGSNGSLVFPFFDHFDRTALGSVWGTEGTPTLSGSNLVISATNGWARAYTSSAVSTVGSRIAARVYVPNAFPDPTHYRHEAGLYLNRGNNYACRLDWDNYNDSASRYYNFNGSQTRVAPTGLAASTWQVIELSRMSDRARWKVDGANQTDNTGSYDTTNAGTIMFSVYGASGYTGVMYIDWVYQYVFAATEPVVTYIGTNNNPAFRRLVC